MEQMRVFLSHSSADKDFADALVNALRGEGADVWYDESHLGTGQLLDEISTQLPTRPVFLVVLSKAAFASEWVRQECKWAFNLYRREPNRIILPIVARPLDEMDWNAMLWLEDFRRVEGTRGKPYPRAEAIKHTMRLLIDAHRRATPPQRRSRHVNQPMPAMPSEGDPYAAMSAPRLERLQHRRDTIEQSERDSNLDKHVSDRVRQWWNDLRPNLKQAQTDATSSRPTDRIPQFTLPSMPHMPDSSDDLELSEQALALNPKDTLAWISKGKALFELNRYAEALTAINQALAIDPNNAEGWHYKSYTLRELGRDAEANQAQQRAWNLDDF